MLRHHGDYHGISLLASICCLLYIFDQGGVIDLKPSVLAGLSRFPGWEDVFEAYNIGRL